MKTVRLAVLIILSFAIVAVASNPNDIKSDFNWKIEQIGDVPYLVYNGAPYFGRFESTNPRISLDGEWEFAVAPGAGGHPPVDGYMTVAVPGVWNYLKPEMLNYIDVGWFKKTFTVDGKFERNTTMLVFGGVAMRCKVWLNGIEIGEHEGAYSQFGLDVTDKIKYGEENLLLLKVDNRMTFTSLPPLNYEASRMGWFEYGGIHRSVYIESHPSPTIFKIATDTHPQPDGAWVLNISVLLRGPDLQNSSYTFIAKIADIDGQDIAMEGAPAPMITQSDIGLVKFAYRVKTPKLWSPETPDNRYRLTIKTLAGESEIESVSTEIGFKNFEANAKGLFLNGKPYYIRGINRHEDDPTTGLVETRETIERDMNLIKELHVNHMRTAHYPNDPRWLDEADRRGIGITEEIPLYQAGVGWLIWLRDRVQRNQKIGKMFFSKVKPAQFTEHQLVRNAVLQLVETIERDRNHPSLLAWSIGNENWTFTDVSCETYRILKSVSKKFDPDRAVTFALLQSIELGPISEKCADIADFISANEYFGWYVGETDDVDEYLEKLHSRFPSKPIIVSEFGADGILDPSKVREKRQDGQGTFDPNYQAALIARQWEIILTKPYVWGAMPWVFADFRNAWFKEEHPIPFFNTKGLLTYERKPKPAYFTLQKIYKNIENQPPQWAR